MSVSLQPSYEQGPIRPPNEARSLLLRLTRNCPWNRCKFCPVYKGARFSRRPLAEIKADIDQMALATEQMAVTARRPGMLDRVFSDVGLGWAHRQAAVWLARGQGAVFLQDANNLVLDPEVLVQALVYLRQRLPGVRRVTTYARAGNLARLGVAGLTRLKAAGLDRVHVGLESGSGRVLEFMRKGVTPETYVKAGQAARQAGLELSLYVMPGLGGQQWWTEHARETAQVLREARPHFVRLRSLAVAPGTELDLDCQAGRFTPSDDPLVVRELREFVAGLVGLETNLVSDHALNLIPALAGDPSREAPVLLDLLDQYLALSPADQLFYGLARRMGRVERPDDLVNQPGLRQKLAPWLDELSRRPDPWAELHRMQAGFL